MAEERNDYDFDIVHKGDVINYQTELIEIEGEVVEIEFVGNEKHLHVEGKAGSWRVEIDMEHIGNEGYTLTLVEFNGQTQP